MSGALVAAICTALPGAEVSDPQGAAMTPGHDAWKIGGRMFACIGTRDRRVAVKTADFETAQLLIQTGHAAPAACFHKSRVLIPWGAVDDADLKGRLHGVCRIIRKGLTR